MRVSHFKLLLSLLFLPAFLSAELNETENSSHEMSSSHHCSKKSHGAVFASYRNNQTITIPGGGNVLFNVKNANKGNGIDYLESGIFTINKSGFYLINYGLASIGNAGSVDAGFGFNLIRIRNDQQEILDSVLANSSSAIILFLKENDRLAVISQQFEVTLVAGSLPPRTTSLTDTAHITFLKLDN